MPDQLEFKQCDPNQVPVTNLLIENGCHRLEFPWAEGVATARIGREANEDRLCACAVCEVAGVRVRIGMSSHALDQVLHPLIRASEFLSLPEDLQLALLNNASSGLSGTIGAEVLFRQFAATAGDSAAATPVAVEPPEREPYRIAINVLDPVSDSALTLIRRLGSAASNPIRQLVTVTATFQVGHTELPAQTVRSLTPGAVVMTDAYHLGQGLLRMVAAEAKVEAMVGYQANRLSFETAPRSQRSLASDDAIAHPTHPDSGAEEASSADAEALASFDELPVQLEFVCGRARFSISELEKIQPGYVMDLHIAADAQVEVQANGRPIGRGELVDVGGRAGVRLLEWFPAGT